MPEDIPDCLRPAYLVTWPVPVTRGDALVYVSSRVAVPDYIIEEAVKRIRFLSSGCPAGGVLPKPNDGERFALQGEDGTFYFGTDETLPRFVQRNETISFTLVILDSLGQPYEPEELIETRPQAVPA